MRGIMKLRCQRCNNIIANYIAGCWVVSRHGREWIGREVVSIRCERCHTVWVPEADHRGRTDEKAAHLA